MSNEMFKSVDFWLQDFRVQQLLPWTPTPHPPQAAFTTDTDDW